MVHFFPQVSRGEKIRNGVKKKVSYSRKNRVPSAPFTKSFHVAVLDVMSRMGTATELENRSITSKNTLVQRFSFLFFLSLSLEFFFFLTFRCEAEKAFY